jgi:CheY-like chemotaxis protein
VKILLLDDSDALGRYIVKEKPAGVDFDVYCVDPTYYGRGGSVDDFFHAILTESAWRTTGDAQGNGKHSLTSLTGETSANCLFLIHVNLKPAKTSARQDQEGLELLKHIRLTDKDELGDGRNTHVVLYSFEDQVALLKRKPVNLVMLSEGVTFVRLPDGLNKIADPTDLSRLADKPADVTRKEFKRFVQCDFEPPDAAHEFSNWWGVRQLLKAAITCGERDLQMPQKVVNEIRKLNNKKARFLYEQKRQRTYLNEERQRISNDNHRVLHIDDEVEWSEVLRDIIKKDAPGADFKAVDEIYQNIAEGDKKTEKWVIEKVLSNDGITSDLVLLDLRLYGTRDAKQSVERTSGAIVAKTIRQLYPGIPIILMTASNKAWVFEEMMKLGVDAYWMKEGIGEHLPPGDSVRNYIKLTKFLATALGEEYQFLRRVAEDVYSIEGRKRIWWDNYRWTTGERTHADRDEICSRLKSIVLLLREYLHLFAIGYGYTYTGQLPVMQASWLNALLMEASRVCELIHASESLPAAKREETIWKREDNLARYIYGRRSRLAAHAGGNRKQTTFTDVREVIAGLMLLIRLKPEDRWFRWEPHAQCLKEHLQSNTNLLKRYNKVYERQPTSSYSGVL